MKTICIVTGTRAEYGLLRPLIRGILADGTFHLRLVVTGMHLCPEFGLTDREIEDDGFVIDEKLEIMLSSDTNVGMTKSTGLAMFSFAEYFNRKRPDLLVVLGDRFEIFACATAAALARIPIAHLHGGDTTEGATDEFLRHSVTKMSTLHFPASETSRRRVIQLGEHPDRVFNFGALGVENVLNVSLLSLPELEESLNWKLSPQYALVTFHPVTLETNSAETQLCELFAALDQFPNLRFLFTKANADADGRKVNALLDEYTQNHSHCAAFTSLGIRRYLSAMKYCKVVIGNSSSGLYEAPSMRVPTVNIGDRQRGREQADSIINCPPTRDEIVTAIASALSAEWVNRAKNTVSPFGDGNTSGKIVEAIKLALAHGDLDVKKTFYEIGQR